MLNSKLISVVTFFSLFVSSSAFSCPEAFTSPSARKQITTALFKKKVKDSLSHVLKPESLEKANLEPCGPGCLRLVSKTSVSFEIKLDPNISSPEFLITKGSKILQIPSKNPFHPPPSANDLRYWLVGHEIHPYMESPGKIMIKPVQSIALQAYKEAVQSGAKSFLHIGSTAVGKTLVFTKALTDHLKNQPKEKNIVIVTVDKVHIVDQLSQAIRKEITEPAESLDIQVINWNNKKQGTDFSTLVSETSSRADATVLVMTSQSLKHILRDPDSEHYKQIAAKLSAIFIDEAHHLGAYLTKEVLLGLQENSGAFLYGTTATPVHHDVNLRGLFEKVHWSYINDRDSLFQDHPSEGILRQLSIGIKRGDLTPFDDLYFIAEAILTKEEKNGNIFVSENNRRVLNPDYYQKLAQVIYPILNSNKKGFFVTATVQEAEHLTAFLNHTFPEIEFSSYHYKKTSEEKKEIRNRFEENENSHYLVTVRTLDEGVNLPGLSSYIDLNASIPIKQMLQRIGRVLRLYPGKISSDIVLLIDYRNEQTAMDLLNVLDVIKQVSFSRTKREEDVSEDNVSNEEVLLNQPEAKVLSREDLTAFQKMLEDIVRKFWDKKIPILPWEEGLKKAQNAKLPSYGAYREWRKDHPDMPSDPSTYKPYQPYWKGWTHFLGNEKTEILPWEEGFKKVREAKPSSSRAYMEWQKNHPDMPSDPGTYKPYQPYWKGWTHFLGNEKLPWEEGFKKAGDAKLSGQIAYRKWQKDHPDMPTWPPTYKPWQKYWKGWTHFLGNEKLPWEEGLKKAREAKLLRINYMKWQKDHLDMPSEPDTYKPWRKYWKGWPHFLGNKKLPWEEGVKKAGDAKLSSQIAYRKWQKDHPDMPTWPPTYKPWQKYWKGWTHFLGMEKTELFLPWEEGFKKAGDAKLSGQIAYRKWQKDHPDMPSAPSTYKPWQKYWKGWDHFLGNEKLPWEEGFKKAGDAKLSSQIAYRKWQKDHPDMPSDPSKYKPWQKYWKGWDHFFGREETD